MKSNMLQNTVNNDFNSVDTVYNEIINHSFSCCSELVQHFDLQIWLLLLRLLPSTITHLQESTLHQFVHSTLEISVSMSSFNDRDGLSKQFFTTLVEQSPSLPFCSFHFILSFLLHYQGLTSNIPSFILILLQKQPNLLQSEEYQQIFKFTLNLLTHL